MDGREARAKAGRQRASVALDRDLAHDDLAVP